jgi:hypothetical protein
MSLVKATEMERIDPFAIQPTKAEEIDTTLEEMWRSGRRSREGRLCVLRSADGVHMDALRRFAKRVSRRLPAAKIEDASLGSIVQHSSDAIYRPIVVVRTEAHCTAKSVLRAAAKALGTLHHASMSIAETCTGYRQRQSINKRGSSSSTTSLITLVANSLLTCSGASRREVRRSSASSRKLQATSADKEKTNCQRSSAIMCRSTVGRPA